MSEDEMIQDIVNKIRAVPSKEICLPYSFTRKSSFMAWCADQAEKRLTLYFVRDKKRIFPDMLNRMDEVADAWKGLGHSIEIKDIDCKIKVPEQAPPNSISRFHINNLTCHYELIKFKEDHPELFFLSTITKDFLKKYKRYHIQYKKNFAYPFDKYTASEIYALRHRIPPELFVALESFDCPHYCANPICPHWKEEHPESLTRSRRWTDE